MRDSRDDALSCAAALRPPRALDEVPEPLDPRLDWRPHRRHEPAHPRPHGRRSVTLQTIGVRFMIPGIDTVTRLSLVEHPMPARALAAPLHRHNREDEYSFILEGRMGALLGGDVVEAGPGDLVYKPRGQWHTFWNAGDEPARILEIISPAGFEQFFAELAPLAPAARPTPTRSASSAVGMPWRCSPRAFQASAPASESGSRASASAASSVRGWGQPASRRGSSFTGL